MSDVKTQKKEFISLIRVMEDNSKQPIEQVPLLIVEYGLAELVVVLSRNQQRQLAYHLIHDHAESLKEEGLLSETAKILWRGGGTPIYRWVLNTLRDCKSQLGNELFNSLVYQAITTKDVELCACLVLECDLSEDQINQAVQIVTACNTSVYQKWKRRLIRYDKLNAYQKTILQSEALTATGTG